VIVFLVDEDLPRTLAPSLRQAGLGAEDVRDRGLGGRPDSDIIAFTVSHRRVLVTRDVGVANLTRFPAGSEFGIVLVRLAQAMTTYDLNARIVAVLRDLKPADLVGSITVVEPGRIRVRRRSP
jgi:predicted nuclease of predicted toxin-antitoxin system